MKNATQTEEVCTTQRAAELLGISVSTVQQLVEAGEIEAWKTKGGHRRIPLAAVMAYKLQPGAELAPAKPHSAPGAAAVLIVEDNPMQRQLYQKQIGSWGLPATLALRRPPAPAPACPSHWRPPPPCRGPTPPAFHLHRSRCRRAPGSAGLAARSPSSPRPPTTSHR